ncbi:MAG: peptidylprolyl isomerase [Desulfovibrionaceae bacterium]|nr:peptidylprolyl isomerase [Desulfovibrionaceae bacterium]
MKNEIVVEIKTGLGDLALELWPDKAPKTVENFLSYLDQGHYDGTIFHRVIPGFMIQGGGMDREMREKKTRAPVPNEAKGGPDNRAYTVAMARTMDPHSATAQFFINVADNDFLNHRDATPQGFGYAVFGRVLEGLEVVEAIAKTPTGRRGLFEDAPLEPVEIVSARRRG